MPQGNWISWVEASRFDPAVAYVTDDRHAYGDMQPYLYRTTDYGRTWQRLVGPGNAGRSRLCARDQGRPAQSRTSSSSAPSSASTCQPQRRRSRGRSSSPTTSPTGSPCATSRCRSAKTICVLATHGRGIWVIDDISPLRALTRADARKHGRADSRRAGRAAHPGQWRLGRRRCHLRRRQPAERRVDHLLPEGAARDRPDEARDPRCERQGRRRNPDVEAARPQSRRTGRCGPSRRRFRPRPRLPALRPQGERFLPGTYTVRLTKAGQVVDRAADGHARPARDLHASPTVRRSSPRSERVKGMFARMSKVVAQINGVRRRPAAIAAQRIRTCGRQGRGGAAVGQGRRASQGDRRDQGRRRDHRRGAAARACRRDLRRDQLGRGPPDCLPDGAHRRARSRAEGSRDAMGGVAVGRCRDLQREAQGREPAAGDDRRGELDPNDLARGGRCAALVAALSERTSTATWGALQETGEKD